MNQGVPGFHGAALSKAPRTRATTVKRWHGSSKAPCPLQCCPWPRKQLIATKSVAIPRRLATHRTREQEHQTINSMLRNFQTWDHYTPATVPPCRCTHYTSPRPHRYNIGHPLPSTHQRTTNTHTPTALAPPTIQRPSHRNIPQAPRHAHTKYHSHHLSPTHFSLPSLASVQTTLATHPKFQVSEISPNFSVHNANHEKGGHASSAHCSAWADPTLFQQLRSPTPAQSAPP